MRLFHIVLFVGASLAGGVAACGSDDGAATCQSASSLICQTACACPGGCNVDGFEFDSESDCRAFLQLGCGGDADVDWQKCETDIASATCGASGLETPDSCAEDEDVTNLKVEGTWKACDVGLDTTLTFTAEPNATLQITTDFSPGGCGQTADYRLEEGYEVTTGPADENQTAELDLVYKTYVLTPLTQDGVDAITNELGGTWTINQGQNVFMTLLSDLNPNFRNADENDQLPGYVQLEANGDLRILVFPSGTRDPRENPISPIVFTKQ